MLKCDSRKYSYWKFYSSILFFQKTLLLQALTGGNSVCMTLLIIVLKLDLQRVIIHMMDYRNLPLRQSYSGHIFVKVTCQGTVFVNNDQHKTLDLMVHNLLGFRNFDFWPNGYLAQISAILIFSHLQKPYEH